MSNKTLSIRQAVVILRRAGLASAVSVLAAHAASAATTSLHALCHLTLTATPSAWTINNYNPFATATATAHYQLVIADDGAAACNRNLSIAAEDPYGLVGPGGAVLPYTLFDSTHNLDVTPIYGTYARQAAIAPISLQPGGQQIINYTFEISLNTLPADGLYQQYIDLSADSVVGPNNDGGPVDFTQRIPLNLRVVPSAVVSLRGQFSRGHGGGATIDLGELTSGPVQGAGVSLYVQSTRGYALSLTSSNNGRLVRGTGGWSVPYTVSLNGHAFNFSNTAPLQVASATSARQDLLPMSFTIGDTSLLAAGDYSDTITVQVEAY
jgi:hypothetical protein